MSALVARSIDLTFLQYKLDTILVLPGQFVLPIKNIPMFPLAHNLYTQQCCAETLFSQSLQSPDMCFAGDKLGDGVA